MIKNYDSVRAMSMYIASLLLDFCQQRRRNFNSCSYRLPVTGSIELWVHYALCVCCHDVSKYMEIFALVQYVSAFMASFSYNIYSG